ncbi:MAG: sigma-70 family RNA polymerase sigma factor [Patescibacteria group bacterium]
MALPENCDQKTDEELVVLALKDQGYFLYIMKRYTHRLLGYIIRMSGLSEEDAEDLLQDVFIKVYRNLNNFDQTQKFSSWIYSIARHQAISNFRKLKSRPKSVTWDNDDEFLKNISSDFSLETELDGNLNQEMIEQVLNALDYKYKEVLALKFIEGRDYKEIADIIKKPMGTVATLINRAKRKFKEEFKKQNIKL